jgi:subtilase family serine protease
MFALWLGVAATPSFADSAQVRIGVVPRLPRGTTLVAGIASVRSLELTVALAPRDVSALAAYSHAVSDSSSTEYRHYLTPAQFRRRFAPTHTALAAVERSMRDHGLHVASVTANGLAIHVSGSGGAVERAFSLSLARVRLRGGRDALVNTQTPAVDAAIAPGVQAIIGLSSVAEMQELISRRNSGEAETTQIPRTSSAHIATGGPQPCAIARDIAPGQGAYTADQIATAYELSGLYRAGDFGQGVTIGAYELESDAPSDIAAYQHCYGTHTSVTYVKVDAGVGTGSGNGEAALDIEQLIGLAPQAKIIVYQGPNNNSDDPGTGPYDTLAAMVGQDKVQVISNSWGECETLEGTRDAHAENTLLEEAATQGQTFVSAAGDTGSSDCYSPPPGGNENNALAVDDPGSQPYATSVGGTTMTAIGPAPVETVWDDDNPDVDYARFGIEQGAGGGGISSLWPMPGYQSSAATTLGVINPESSGTNCAAASGSYCREVPDVSADADPMTSYLDYWNGNGDKSGAETGWQGTGGTSGAAPVWAALFALADANRACSGTLVGFANSELYELASQSQATYFNDITTGNNDFTPSGNDSGLYAATAGYDLASGLGTPKAAALVPALCGQAVHVIDPGTTRNFYSQHVRLALKAKLPAGQTGRLSFRSKYLPLGLHLNRSTGVISGRVHSPGVRYVQITASTAAGTYGTVRFNWVVQRHPKLSVRRAGTTIAAAVALRFNSGQYETGISLLQIRLPVALRLRGASAVKVQTTTGGSLPHTAKLHGRTLTITLRHAHSPLRVVLPTGSLQITGANRPEVSAQIVDLSGEQTTLTRTL